MSRPRPTVSGPNVLPPNVLPPDLYPRSTFWASAAPLLLAVDTTELARRQVAGVLELLDLPAGATVVDLQGAANGQVAVELARRDLDVTTVAFNPALGDLVRQRATAAGVDLRVVVATEGAHDGDWATTLDAVDAVLDLGAPFGVVDGQADPVGCLARVVERLSPGGAVAVLTMGTEVALRDYVGRDWYEHEERLVLLEAEPVHEWTRLEHRWRIYQGDAHSDLEFAHRLVSGRQLRRLLGDAGLAACSLHGADVDGTTADRPYDGTARRLLAVGRR